MNFSKPIKTPVSAELRNGIVFYYDSKDKENRELIYTKRGGDPNWRNNNPENVTYSSKSIGKGALGLPVFPDMETGRKAKKDNKMPEVYSSKSKQERYFDLAMNSISLAGSISKALKKEQSAQERLKNNLELLKDLIQVIEDIKGIINDANGNEIKTVWVWSGGDCAECAGNEGTYFSHPGVSPGLHPNCGCTLEEVDVEKVM